MLYYTDATHARKNHLPVIKVREKSRNRRPQESAGTFCFVVVKINFFLEGELKLLHIHTAAVGKRATPLELLKFNALLKSILTCLLYACLLSSPRLPLAFLNPGSLLVMSLLHQLQSPNIKLLPWNSRPQKQNHLLYELAIITLCMLRKVESVIALVFPSFYAAVDYLIKQKCCESGVKR